MGAVVVARCRTSGTSSLPGMGSRLGDIEQIGGRRFEEGLALAQQRYHLQGDASVVPMVSAFTRVEECEPDELIETPKDILVEFFRRRLPEVVASLGRWDAQPLPPELAERVVRAIRGN